MPFVIRRLPVQIALLALLTVVVYAPALRGDFVFDDLPSIVSNQSIQSWGSALTPPRNTTLAGRPVANLTFALNHALTGLSTAPMHATNVAIHLLAGIILLLLIRTTLRLPRFNGRFDDGVAFVAAALWLLHPLQTESVAYIVQRVESLSALFMLLSLLFALKARVSGTRTWSYGACLAALLAVGSKEIGAVTPLLIVLFDRAFLFESLRDAWRARWKLYLALAICWGLAFVLQLGSPRGVSAGLHFGGFGPWSYLKIQAGAILRYLRLAAWPNDLVFDYGEPGDSVPVPNAFADWGPKGLVVLALVAAALWTWRRSPPLGFLATSFFLVLAPSSSIIPIATEVIAEHRMYLPLAMLATLVAVGASQVAARSPGARHAAVAATIGVVLALGLTTYQRSGLYGNIAKLWEDNTRRWPTNARAWSALGETLQRLNFPHDEAFAAFREAARIDPLARTPNLALANMLQQRGDVPGALTIYRRLQRRWPRNQTVLFDFANALISQRQWGEASEQLRTLVELSPNDAEAHGQYAQALMQTGDEALARAEIDRALTLAPNDPLTLYRCGHLLAARDPVAAIRLLRRSVELDPERTLAKHRLAAVLAQTGAYTEAAQLLRQVVQADASRHSAVQDLSWLLATAPDDSTRNGTEAMKLARNLASPLEGAGPRALETLAAALAETGQFEEAVATQELALAKSSSPSDEMRARMALYRAQKPYRQPAPP